MEKIMIMGSSGSGKSTFARELSELTGFEVVHLDAYFHKPNWVGLDKSSQMLVHDEIMKKKSWIIDGNWSTTLETRLSQSDLVIYMNFSMIKCLYRVFTRYIKNKGKVRIDSAKGCEEKIDIEFIIYIINYHRKKKKKIIETLKKTDKTLIIINSKKEKYKFIDNFIKDFDADTKN